MALARGKYGVEFNPRQMDDDSSGLGWIVVVVAVLAAVALACALVSRFRKGSGPDAARYGLDEPSAAVAPAVAEAQPPAVRSEAPPLPAAAPVESPQDMVKRPAKVRNLLMRLEEAEKARNVELAVNTIETIRALPGSPAADLDDVLARRLGVLNVRRLFVNRNAQWVARVTVRRGDSASRIAAEHGSTLASMARLNEDGVDRLSTGRQVYVMNHPRFNLVVHRRSRTADLSLNGKFFRRYDLLADVTSAAGALELPERKRTFWTSAGLHFSGADRRELEMLLPAGTPVLISEM